MDELRRQAEARLYEQAATPEWLSPEEMQHLIHELHVHQIELEIQNEELRGTQNDLEASRNKYAALYDFAPVGYCAIEADGTLADVNLTAVKQLGRQRAELLNTRLYHYIAEEHRETLFLHLRKVFATQTHHRCEIKFFRQNGSTFWGQLESIAVLDEKTDTFLTNRCQTTITDISERKQKEFELDAIAQRLQTVIETVGEGITLSDEQGCFVIFNSKMEEITGYTRAEANQTQDFLTLLYPDAAWREQTLAGIQDVLSCEGEQNVETVIQAKNGDFIALLVSTSIIWENGKRYFLSAYRDISGLKQVEQDLQRESQLRGELLREVNHRVGNNLTAIAGLLSMEIRHLGMAEHEHDVAYREILQDLNARVGSLAKVHEMLSSSAWAPLALDELCRHIIQSSLQQTPFDKHVALDVSSSPVRVTAKHAHHLALILNELTTNTVKYALQERATASILVRICSENEMITLKFQDDGPGYPKDVLRLERLNVGLDLLQRLSRRDLRGTCSLRNDSGAVTELCFPV